MDVGVVDHKGNHDQKIGIVKVVEQPGILVVEENVSSAKNQKPVRIFTYKDIRKT